MSVRWLLLVLAATLLVAPGARCASILLVESASTATSVDFDVFYDPAGEPFLGSLDLRLELDDPLGLTTGFSGTQDAAFPLDTPTFAEFPTYVNYGGLNLTGLNSVLSGPTQLGTYSVSHDPLGSGEGFAMRAPVGSIIFQKATQFGVEVIPNTTRNPMAMVGGGQAFVAAENPVFVESPGHVTTGTWDLVYVPSADDGLSSVDLQVTVGGDLAAISDVTGTDGISALLGNSVSSFADLGFTIQYGGVSLAGDQIVGVPTPFGTISITTDRDAHLEIQVELVSGQASWGSDRATIRDLTENPLAIFPTDLIAAPEPPTVLYGALVLAALAVRFSRRGPASRTG